MPPGPYFLRRFAWDLGTLVFWLLTRIPPLMPKSSWKKSNWVASDFEGICSLPLCYTKDATTGAWKVNVWGYKSKQALPELCCSSQVHVVQIHSSPFPSPEFFLLRNVTFSFLKRKNEVWNDASDKTTLQEGEREKINTEYKEETIQETESRRVSISSYNPGTSGYWGLHSPLKAYLCQKRCLLSSPVPKYRAAPLCNAPVPSYSPIWNQNVLFFC